MSLRSTNIFVLNYSDCTKGDSKMNTLLPEIRLFIWLLRYF